MLDEVKIQTDYGELTAQFEYFDYAVDDCHYVASIKEVKGIVVQAVSIDRAIEELNKLLYVFFDIKFQEDFPELADARKRDLP